METFFIMLKNVLLFVALALPGYLLVRTGKLKAQGSGVISGVMMYVGLPFLILSGTMKLKLEGALLLTLLIASVLLILFIVLFFLLSSPLLKKVPAEKTRGMMRFCAVFPNNGFLGIPLAMAVFGADSTVLTILIVLNVLTNLMMYTLGAYLVSGDKKSMDLKQAILNPAMLAALVGVVLNLLNLPEHIPELTTFATYLSNIVVPGSMIVLGMKMADVSLKDILASKSVYYVSFLKLILFPLLSLVLLLALGFVPNLLLRDMILAFFFAFAVPTAGLGSAFADRFDGDAKSATTLTLGSTFLSVVTLPVLYWVIYLFL